METHLADFIRTAPQGQEAEAILRNCVHCGFCNATCPTYQLFGDELDGPRGRIYLIKQVLEGTAPTAKSMLHLDRCLTCRACETTCPSGVHYSRLLDIGRVVIEQRVARRKIDAVKRWALKAVLPRKRLFGVLIALARAFRPILPKALNSAVPKAQAARPPAQGIRDRTMIMLGGCVQPALSPNINIATARVLDSLGITVIDAPRAGCCGALRFHLNDAEAARDDARRNIDAWWPLIEAGAEAIVSTASGCGVQLQDYDHLLRHDTEYSDKAKRISGLAQDISQIVSAEVENLASLLKKLPSPGERVAFHSPCTLQHGLKIRGAIEGLLNTAGFKLTPVPDAHLCCGSAGTYSILQPEISRQLRDAKLEALASGGPAQIVSANIGCIGHLQAGTRLPVKHWIELVDDRLSASEA